MYGSPARPAQGEAMKRLTCKERVLKEFPGAWFNAKERIIEGYSAHLELGYGDVLAKSIEKSAWKDAAKRIKQYE
jgi:hypothetical protein